MNPRPLPHRLRATELERRDTPAGLRFVFDYRFDDTGFFTDHPDRIAVLNQAAADVASRFTDELTAIPYPTTPGDFWKARFRRPSGAGQDEEVLNLLVPANAMVVFVGARNTGLGDDGLIDASSWVDVSGSADWINTVRGRGQTNAFGSAATDVGPWGGSIAFDQFDDWHFGIDPPGNSQEFDLYTAAQHGLLHLMGFGNSDAFTALAASGSFLGQQATTVYGGPVPLSGGKYHWVEDTLSQGQRTLMDEHFEDGERITPTALDVAALDDIGWTPVGASPPPPPPPAAPPVPVLPPLILPAGYDFFAVGADAGLNSEVTLNEASTMTRVGLFSPFTGAGGQPFTGGARVATADLNADGVADIVAGTGPGIANEVRIFSGKTFPVDPDGSELRSVRPFESSFTGGVFLSVGDVNGDGVPDVAVSPDQGGGPRVRVYNGKGGGLLADFFGIEDPNFRGGVRTAVGDLNGDGVADLLVAAGFGGGPRVAGFDGTSLRPGQTPKKLFADFFAFEQSLRNGVYIAAGDLNGDKSADVLAGGGPGGGPRVLGLSGKELTASNQQVAVANFFAGDPNNRGGVRLTTRDVDHDGRADVIAGAGTGAQSVVTTYLGSQITPTSTPPVFLQYLMFDSSFTGGVFVG
ncbi:MAG: VCBS repeat-containing protein [Gemmataceae bacterium]